MSQPTFLSKGTTPQLKDTEWYIQQRILGALNSGGFSLAPITGSPEGVTTAPPGSTVYDSAGNDFWVKSTGTGNTGWVRIVNGS